ncbi:hypothetical protein PUN4_350059 [Paraburkholderia unamae]|nr:hypothetical protein PUN4_350059 [Paraburkholderia unamae]
MRGHIATNRQVRHASACRRAARAEPSAWQGIEAGRGFPALRGRARRAPDAPPHVI